MLHLFVVRPLYQGVRWVRWTVSGAVERDDPPAPATEEHPRFVAQLAPPLVVRGFRAFHGFALGGDGRVLVAQEDDESFVRWDPVEPERRDPLPIRSGTTGLATTVSPDGHLLADLAGRHCHLARVYLLTGAPEETFDVPVRHPSPAVAAWPAGGEDEPRECEDEVAALGLAAPTREGARPLVVVSALQSFVGTRLEGDFGPAAVLVRTYDVARPDAPLLAETLHPFPPRDGPHDRETVLSPDTRLLAVGPQSGEEVRHHTWRGTATVTRHRSSVALHRTDDGTLLDDLPVRADQIAFAAGGRLVVSGPDGISLWDAAVR